MKKTNQIMSRTNQNGSWEKNDWKLNENSEINFRVLHEKMLHSEKKERNSCFQFSENSEITDGNLNSEKTTQNVNEKKNPYSKLNDNSEINLEFCMRK